MSADLSISLGEVESHIRDTKNLVRVVLSGRRKSMTPSIVRIDMKPVQLKDTLLLQISENDGRQTRTTNQDPQKINLKEILHSGFSNFLVEHLNGSISIRVTKKDTVLVHRQNGEFEQNLDHDRKKNRLLDSTDPYLREVGISDASGNVKPSRQDKYRQVEEFLRLLEPTLNSAIEAKQIAKPSTLKPLKIVDLGCGNAYLTFATHQYLQSKKIPVKVTGIDVRVDSRNRNTEIAKRLGIADSMNFIAEEISSTSIADADVVIALHACDTATDDAIAWAVERGSKIILVAPCCHHDLQTQMTDSPEPWKLITKHGLLRERFGDLLTDALRAHILKLVGYRSEVIEFIGDTHTPRNLMIRAVKTNASISTEDLLQYQTIISFWKIRPALAERLKPLLEPLLESLLKDLREVKIES